MNFKNIKIENLLIQKGDKILFENTDVSINNGVKYALIGKNGIGKSSLADFIFNKEDKNISEFLDILYINQEVSPNNNTVINEVLTSNKEREALLEINTRLLEKLENDEDEIDIKLLESVQLNQDQLSSIDYEKDESKVKKILHGLGFNDNELDLPLHNFSGGWRMRISLAKALYLEPSLLILDEPTNHLDLEAVIWLTDYLNKWKKTLILISHNIGFINEICDQIIHCEEKKLNYYKGNYYSFRKNYDIDYNRRVKLYDQYEKKLKALKKGKKSTKKDIDNFIKKEKVVKIQQDRKIKYGFPDVYDMPSIILELKNIDFSYDEDKCIFKNLNLTIHNEDRIALVGRNGVGKSTLFKLLNGIIKPNKGNLLDSNKLKIGYFNQHFEDILPMNSNSIEYLKSLDTDLSKEDVRKYLGTFQIPGKTHLINISDLSGGQKARLLFIGLIIKEPHILLLDEPTNHLDIETVEWLIEKINEYNGSVIVISHDEELITSINAKIYILSDKNIKKFYGNYYDYREKILE